MHSSVIKSTAGSTGLEGQLGMAITAVFYVRRDQLVYEPFSNEKKACSQSQEKDRHFQDPGGNFGCVLSTGWQ